MKHHRVISREPVAAQTTLQVKLDFLTGISDVGVSVAQSLVTFSTSLVSTLADILSGAGTAFFDKGLGGI
ncbi:MAG: hypothetical protein JXR94_23550 [Candidatus Hydrogenedentes bacterium]|nr:hypothetical protein [Candidatus Hydrogenedentota bacterium]